MTLKQRTCPSCGATFMGARGMTYCSLTCAGTEQAPRRSGTSSRHLEHSSKRGYDHVWRALRLKVLDRDEWQCQLNTDADGRYDPDGEFICLVGLSDGKGGNATVDHVVEFDGLDDPLRLDPDNCVAACRTHNSAKAARNTNRKRRANSAIKQEGLFT